MAWFTAYDAAAGRESLSAWIAKAAFWASLFKFLVNGATLHWGHDQSIDLGTVDAALLGAFLGTCFALYFGRRFTDAWENKGSNLGPLMRPPAPVTPAEESAAKPAM